MPDARRFVRCAPILQGSSMNSTVLVSIGGLVLTVVFYLQAQKLPSMAKRLPGLLIWIVAILAILMLVEELIKKRKAKKQRDDDLQNEHQAHSLLDELHSEIADDEIKEPIHWRVLIFFSVAVVAYVLLIPWLGYLLSTVAFMAGVLIVSGASKWLLATSVGVGFTFFIWVVFVWFLRLPAPLLPWFF